MRLRQIALVAEKLDPVVADLTDVFGLGEPYADPGVETFGLCNAVFPIGDTFLEVVSPAQMSFDHCAGSGGLPRRAETRRPGMIRLAFLAVRLMIRTAQEGSFGSLMAARLKHSNQE